MFSDTEDDYDEPPTPLSRAMSVKEPEEQQFFCLKPEEILQKQISAIEEVNGVFEVSEYCFPTFLTVTPDLPRMCQGFVGVLQMGQRATNGEVRRKIRARRDTTADISVVTRINFSLMRMWSARINEAAWRCTSTVTLKTYITHSLSH